MIELLNAEEIEKMKAAGKLTAKVLAEVEKAIKPGVSTKELDQIAYDVIVGAGGRPSCLNYGDPPFPATICASVNDEVVHGIPSKNRILKEGDIITIDVVAELDGFNGDAARTFCVGEVDEDTRLLIKRTEEAFYKGLEQCKIGNRIGDISHAVQEYAESFGYGVVRVLTGHGIGREMHQDPDVPNYGKPGRGARIKEGMAFCVEPMINRGTFNVEMLDDEWTIVTADGKPSAHYENTIVMTADGPIMTTI